MLTSEQAGVLHYRVDKPAGYFRKSADAMEALVHRRSSWPTATGLYHRMPPWVAYLASSLRQAAVSLVDGFDGLNRRPRSAPARSSSGASQ